MKLLLIGYVSGDDRKLMMPAFQKQFADILSTTAQDVSYCYYDDLGFLFRNKKVEIINQRSQQKLEAYDHILLKGNLFYTNIAHVISRYLHDKGVAFQNDYTSYKSINKLPQLYEMADQDLRFPDTIFSLNHQRMLDMVKDLQWHFPLIAKTTGSSGGKDNYLVCSFKELKELFQSKKRVKFMVQKFIPVQDEYRIFIVGEKQVIVKRTPKATSHLANSNKGGSTELVENSVIPDTILRHAHLWAKNSGQAIAGVDVVKDKRGEFFFLELNTQPGWRNNPEIDNLIKNLIIS